MLWNMPILGSNPASLVISSDRGSLYIHREPWVTEKRQVTQELVLYPIEV